jgi:HlyD family secretion protein
MRRRLFPIILILAIAGAAYLYTTRASAQTNGGLTASGTIETTDVTIAPEVGGRVLEVLAKESDAVQAGQVVIHMDDSLLKAQLAQSQQAVVAAQAAVKAAQANYDLVKAGPQAEQIAAAEDAVRNMAANVANAQAQLAQLRAAPKAADIAAAQAAVDKAASDVTSAQQAYDGVVEGRKTAKEYGVPGGGLGLMEEKARAQLQAIQANYDVAVKRLAQLKAGATKNEIDAAQAKVEMAQAQQAQAQAQLDQLKSGARPEQLAASQAQIDVARAQADSAAAAIDVLQVQINRLTLSTPLAGVVLKRAIEPGEVVLPGASLLTIGDLTNLYIVVYVAESRYGEIKLGQTVQINVDSFAGQTFTGKVTHIADQAEFTPRNVQTAEGRATTVFAVRVDVTNVDGKLKPGMPADVVFVP